jgi:hypothetical protein
MQTKPPKRINFFEILPLEIIELILNFLPPYSILFLSKTSRAMHAITSHQPAFPKPARKLAHRPVVHGCEGPPKPHSIISDMSYMIRWRYTVGEGLYEVQQWQ